MNEGIEGIICPFCQTENRPGARFCIECGSSLAEDQSATAPIAELGKNLDTIKLDNPGSPSEEPVAPVTKSSEEKTHPLNNDDAFDSRPSGAIFTDQFLMEQLVYTDSSQHHYIVHHLAGKDSQYRVCPDPECGAIHPPGIERTIYCTDCGTKLDHIQPSLLLVETPYPAYKNASTIVEKSLSHGRVRPPLFVFEEKLGPSNRSCIVQPLTQPIDSDIEAWQVLDWGPELARALSYLHLNDIYFDGEINASCFALDRDRAVWADFSKCRVANPPPDKSRQADIRALTQHLYYWLTGNTKYRRDPRLTDGLNSVFERGMSPETFSTAAELALSLENAISDMVAPRVIDYQSGRRTDVGRQRTLNEDSMLVLEFNRLIKSASHPVGLYLIADGMGGHTAGEVASMTIVNAVSGKASADLFNVPSEQQADFDYEQWLRQAIQDANAEVLKIRQSTGTDLGSTLVAALVISNNTYIAHVGDSRAYLIKPGQITQLTVDHSLVERLVSTGQITPQEARIHPQRNVIYRTIGDRANVEIDTSSIKLSTGDRLLLCSDGLSGMITDDRILNIIEGAPSPQAACDALVDAANTAGGEDNVTVILVEVFAT